MRPVLKLALLMYLAAATWSLTTRFVAWGDDVSVLVGTVTRSMAFEEPRVHGGGGGGIDFIECMCPPSYSDRGIQYAGLALFLGSAPLALATSRLRRRWSDSDVAPPSGGAQTGFLLQLITLPLTLFITPFVMMGLAMEGVSPYGIGIMIVSVMNIACGVPALVDWRRLQAVAFGAPRPLLRLTAQPRVFFPAAGQ